MFLFPLWSYSFTLGEHSFDGLIYQEKEELQERLMSFLYIVSVPWGMMRESVIKEGY